MTDLQNTPSGMRTHIGFFGRTNSGKSTLINALASQDVSIVSSEKGTTTDPVYKAIEISPIGPCLLIDTAGFDDDTVLGEQRLKKTRRVAKECDIAVLVSDDGSLASDSEILTLLESLSIPVIRVINHISSPESLPADNSCVIHLNAASGRGISSLKEALKEAAKTRMKPSILGNLIQKEDLVLLVMPQDQQAPKGRLILPQVTTLRELLDRHCVSICITPEELEMTLKRLKEPPKLIITDSQVFDFVYEHKPESSKLTSFSVLFAALKGDIPTFVSGARSMADLKPGARILIAESCSHAPMEEDIGRVKIPTLMKKKIQNDLRFDVCSGKDFPEDLSDYDLILQCGGCMVNRQNIQSRIQQAKRQGIPITNYGICIAYLKGILDHIVLP